MSHERDLLKRYATDYADGHAHRKCDLDECRCGLSGLNLEVMALLSAAPEPTPAQPWRAKAADALADACEAEVRAGRIDSRSPIGDALLDYRDERESTPAPPERVVCETEGCDYTASGLCWLCSQAKLRSGIGVKIERSKEWWLAKADSEPEGVTIGAVGGAFKPEGESTPAPTPGSADRICVCRHRRGLHDWYGKCTVEDCACGPGCIHDGFVDEECEPPVAEPTPRVKP